MTLLLVRCIIGYDLGNSIGCRGHNSNSSAGQVLVWHNIGQKVLPENLADVWHRARDIIHTDKTDHNVRMSKVISKYLLLLKEMHDIISNVKLDGEMRERFMKIEPEYHKLAHARGAIIQEITRIERTEDTHFIFEDADFSIVTIKKLIKQGEEDTEKALAENQKRQRKDNKI